MTNKIKQYMKTLFRIFSLLLVFTAFATTASADYYLRFNNTGSTEANPSAACYKWSDGAAPVNNVCTWTYSMCQHNNYIYLAKDEKNVSKIVSLPNAYTVNDPGSLLNWSQRQDLNSVFYLLINGKNAATVTIEWNVSTSVITFTSGTTTYTVTAAGTNCTIDPASATVVSGNDAQFVVTPSAGYSVTSGTITEGTADVVQVGNTFVVTPSSNATLTVTCAKQTYKITSTAGDGGSVSPAEWSDVEYGTSKIFTVTALSGYYLDKASTVYEGQAEISYGQTVDNQTSVTISNVRSNGSLSVAFKTNQQPIVYIAGYPAMGSSSTVGETVNTVNLKGYISALYCKVATHRGFYVSSSPSITASAVETALNASPASDQIIPCNTSCDGYVGSTFKALNVDLRTHGTMFQSAQDLYVVAYVKTTGGGLNISEVIGFNYKICLGIQSVSIEPATVEVAPGFSTQLTAIARGAGVSPNYAWYDNDVLIAGATGSTLTYTMPLGAVEAHTIKVNVSETTCQTNMNATQSVALCVAPEFASFTAAPKTSVTPWQSVTITPAYVAGKTPAKVEWSVTPDAELTVNNEGVATFRGAVLDGNQTIYTITCSAYGDCENSEVKVSQSVNITVNKDSEDCSPKN